MRRRPATLGVMPTTDRHLSLAPLCAAAAAGRRDAIAAAVRGALDAGCTPAEIREALLTLVPFCGYPCTLDAMSAATPILREPDSPAEAISPEGADIRGAAFFDRVYGADAAKVRGNLAALDAEVAAWIERDAYGKVLSRPGITASLRERIGIVLLAAQGLRTQLSGHVRGAMNCGATADEIAAYVEAAAPFIAPEELAFARATVARVTQGPVPAPPG